MKIVFLCVLAILPIFIGHASSAQVDPEEFLFDYGYLEDTGGRSLNTSPEEMIEAILEFQSFYNLPQTGTLNEPTILKMNSLRCGDKDIVPETSEVASYRKPSVVVIPNRNFTWTISKYSTKSGLDHEEQISAIKRCIDRWSEVTPLDFQFMTKGEADIHISFDKKDDNDGYIFNDLSPGSISFATHIPKADIHINDEVKWVIGNDTGYDLEAVVTHEIGHVLGLKKSGEPSAVMYTYYSKRPVDFELHPEDIERVQAIYGKRQTGDKPTTAVSMTNITTTATTETIALKPTTFTWKIKKYCKKCRLSRVQQKLAIRRGFHRWSEVAHLVFTESTGKTDIQISFKNGFRMQLGILAYTSANMVIHFNDFIQWSIGKRKGVSLEAIAAHEIGHTLGLKHSKNPLSIMYSEERPYNFKLHSEDIDKIQALYGKKPAQVTPTVTMPTLIKFAE